MTYRIVKSNSGFWHVYASSDSRWVACSFTLLGAKLSARWDAYKVKRPTRRKLVEVIYDV